MDDADAGGRPHQNPSKQASEEGRLIGMTPEQVRKVFASRPDSVTHVISAGRVDEVWMYNQNADAVGHPFPGRRRRA